MFYWQRGRLELSSVGHRKKTLFETVSHFYLTIYQYHMHFLKLKGILETNHFPQENNQQREQWASLFSFQVPVFLMQAILGFRPSANTMSHVPGNPEVSGPGAYATLCPEVPEVYPVSI